MVWWGLPWKGITSTWNWELYKELIRCCCLLSSAVFHVVVGSSESWSHPKGSLMLWARFPQIQMKPSVCTLHSLRRGFGINSGSLQIRTKGSSTTRNSAGSVEQCSPQFMADNLKSEEIKALAHQVHFSPSAAQSAVCFVQSILSQNSNIMLW